MKLTVLVDNNTLIDRYFLAEPGLCFHINDKDTNLLLDVGYSDIFLRNAQGFFYAKPSPDNRLSKC